MNATSLLTLPADWDGKEEYVETILSLAGVRIERIISRGHTTAAGSWYDQGWDEWVTLLQGEARLAFDDGTELSLGRGDSLYIAAHRRHRVSFTSDDPPCIWLALHAQPL